MRMVSRTILTSALKRTGRGGMRCLSTVSPSSAVERKLEEYTAQAPTPLSIAEFIERGKPGVMTEAASYDHLVKEALVRLSHLITEIR